MLLGDLLMAAAVAPETVGLGVLVTGLLLGIRHGIDWDHIAAITDITSTTTVAGSAEETHRAEHAVQGAHTHGHGGEAEAAAHLSPGHRQQPPGTTLARPPAQSSGLLRILRVQRQPVVLGTLYALGHAFVVSVLGLAALLFGAALPAWIDPIMGVIVGVTLMALGVYVFFALYQYARHGQEFRLRSRWMLVFDSTRHTWRRFQARIHGHSHVEPVEASSYGPRTAFGVGMIHGVGAETASQVLLITAVGGASAGGLGIPMMFAFVIGLVISNTFVVVLSTTGYLAGQLKQRVYIVLGVLTGIFSIVVGGLFLLGAEGSLPDLNEIFGFIG